MIGIDEKGLMYEIELSDGEEVTEETFKEMSDGKGDKKDE